MARPYGPAQTISFVGSLTDGTHRVVHSFRVLAGAQAPTVTGGWAKWTTIDRPQRVGMTVLQGYDPITLTVPILFDAVAYPPADGNDTEDDILILEWMAGRGKLFTPSPFSPALGDSPMVSLAATDSHGRPTNLVPLSYQGNDIAWVVTNIEYDENPIRDGSGDRIRQAATVTLLQHISGPFDSGNDSPATRAKARHGLGDHYYTVTVKPGLRTYQEIATRSARNQHGARTILEANKSNKKLKSIRSTHADLPLGVTVKVPLSVLPTIPVAHAD